VNTGHHRSGNERCGPTADATRTCRSRPRSKRRTPCVHRRGRDRDPHARRQHRGAPRGRGRAIRGVVPTRGRTTSGHRVLSDDRDRAHDRGSLPATSSCSTTWASSRAGFVRHRLGESRRHRADGLPAEPGYVYTNTFADVAHKMRVCRQRGLGPSVAVFDARVPCALCSRYHDAGALPPGTLVKFYFSGGGYWAAARRCGVRHRSSSHSTCISPCSATPRFRGRSPYSAGSVCDSAVAARGTRARRAPARRHRGLGRRTLERRTGSRAAGALCAGRGPADRHNRRDAPRPSACSSSWIGPTSSPGSCSARIGCSRSSPSYAMPRCRTRGSAPGVLRDLVWDTRFGKGFDPENVKDVDVAFFDACGPVEPARAARRTRVGGATTDDRMGREEPGARPPVVRSALRRRGGAAHVDASTVWPHGRRRPSRSRCDFVTRGIDIAAPFAASSDLLDGVCDGIRGESPKPSRAARLARKDSEATLAGRHDRRLRAA